MKQKRVMAIAVGIDEIVGVVAYKVDGQTVIENVITQNRRGTIEQDTEDFFDLYGEEDAWIGCVYEGPLRAICMETPQMEVGDQYSFAKREGFRAFDSEDAPVAIDYASRPSKNGMLLLIVALNNKDGRGMAKAIQRGHGHIKVITYWPEPLAHSRGREESMLFICPETDGVRVSLWSDTFCIANELVTDEVTDILKACDKLIKQGETWRIPYPKGVAITGFKGDVEAMYEDVFTRYGALEQEAVHLVGKGTDYNSESMIHEMAMGLAKRILLYVE